jgi:beta-galactosidase
MMGGVGWLLTAALAYGASEVRTDASGQVLLVDGAPFLVRGMNWDYIPVGSNYRYDLWGQEDGFIEAVLHRELPLLQAMGVNTLRLYDSIPPRWVQWIYERYGIYTMINPLFGRYGISVNGRWVATVNYADPTHREAIRTATLASVERYRSTPGVLLFLLGNENNYGLSWSSFEIEQLPVGDREAAKAKYLYSLFGEVIDAIHAVDRSHPVAIANGDLQYLDLVAKEAPNLDIFGTNVYRGASAGDLYQRVHDTLGVPVLYTEFGADAYDAKARREDGVTQARYLAAQWTELYGQVAGRDGVGNAIGGFVFQWSDGWWKHKQEEDLAIHDTSASWSNGAYREDWAPGKNNMNEEWFGICAKGPPDEAGLYDLYPRPAYYTLKQIWATDPYSDAPLPPPHSDPGAWLPVYQASVGAGAAMVLSKAYVRDLRLDIRTNIALDDRVDRQATFDHTESATFDLGLRPVDGLDAHVAVNVLGNVASNLLDPIQYETRGRELAGEDGQDLSALERVRLYKAEVKWENDWFNLALYHRAGHYHWGYEGDAFGLYREANYGPSADMYNADVPSGVELHGHRFLEGLSIAFGPQIYWGANPTVIGKYRRKTGPLTWTVMHQEDIAPQVQLSLSSAIPQPMGRKSTLSLETGRGPWKLLVGGIVAGTEHLGDTYTMVREASPGASYGSSGYHVLQDQIRPADTLGGRLKFTVEAGPVHAYAAASYKGLVAASGPDQTTTFTGWSLKDSGSGNVVTGLVGVAVDLGPVQIAPNVLLQTPLVGPLPTLDATWDAETGWYTPAVVPRNVVDDPFAVLDNRQTQAAELLVVYDPTPGTWFWSWDAAATEDAPLAMALDMVYRRQPTSRDATIGFLKEGGIFTFRNAPPAADVWDVTLRLFSRPVDPLRITGSLFAGQGQATGEDARLVTRFGGEATVWWRKSALVLGTRFNDWGPYDYQRNFNLTYPFQGTVDLSTGVGRLRLPTLATRFGITGLYRTLDAHSPDADLYGTGAQYQLSTYLRVQL